MVQSPTVLEFTKIQFLGYWERQIIGTNSIYYPGEKEKTALLLVVWQGSTGVEITYEFIVQYKGPNDQGNFNEVWVSWAENIIHVPSQCIKKGYGDLTQCRG
jgi:hypothetical protein